MGSKERKMAVADTAAVVGGFFFWLLVTLGGGKLERGVPLLYVIAGGGC